MGLLITEESYRDNFDTDFEMFLDSVIESGELELVLPDVVLFGDDFTLEDKFKVSRELESIDDLDDISLQPLYYKDNAIYQSLSGNQSIKESSDDAKYSTNDLNNITKLDDAKAKLRILNNKLEESIKKQEEADASKKGWFSSIILQLKRAIAYIKDRIRQGYYAVSDAARNFVKGKDKLRNAHIDYKREVGRQNRLIQKSPLLKREGRAAEYAQNTTNQTNNANQNVNSFNKQQ